MNTQKWSARLAPFKTADNNRSVLEIIATVVPLVAIWLIMWSLLQTGNALAWLAVAALLIPTAGLMVRLFIIQHDCGHGSMFSSKSANEWVGRILGVFTFTPYDYWRKLHAAHHATSGNLDGRGMGDIDTLTVNEYKALSFGGRLRYRLYRNPFVLFVAGPAYMFLLRHRLPVGMTGKPSAWVSVMGNNIGIILLCAVLIKFFGWTAFLFIQLPAVALGASIGVWLFYVQHQFDETYWDVKPGWTHEHAALHGSSYYDLPKPIMWLTGYIGIHHVHHLSSRIPFHKLPAVLQTHPELQDVGRLTFIESLKCIPLALWDEQASRLISFKDARPLLQPA
ncbi:fatty acid desaturase [Chromatiales bacterium (ex Bugula neritina AB1)]|nr:fatty acid desaturase [Chromatiales bacterium (ex Bugula neritina AB1)]